MKRPNHAQGRHAVLNVPRRFAAWAAAVVIVGAAVVGLLIWNRTELQRVSPSKASAQGKPSANPEQVLAEPEQERALRKEQLQSVEKLIAEYPNDDDVVYLAGLVHNEQGDSDTAMKLWARSLELDATRADANESLGYALLLRDDYEKAETYLRKAVELDPALMSARTRLAVALSHQGKMREIVSLLVDGSSSGDADSSTPGMTNSLSPEAHRLLGEAYQDLKEYEKAKASYEAAIRLKPDFSEALYGLSKTYVQLGDRDKGSEYLEKFSALKKASDEEGRRWRASFSPLSVAKKSVAQTHTDVGRVYMKQNRAREAEELWIKAATLDASNTLSRLQLAVLYQQTRREREALQRYEEIVKIDPSDGLVHLNLGRVSLKLKENDRAERAFKEVIRMQPKRFEGHVALAELYLQTKSHLAEAKGLAQTAVALAPEPANFVLLSRTCAANGDRHGALAAINKAIELEPASEEHLRAREILLRSR
jgi:protein O-GlcNAc transferase